MMKHYNQKKVNHIVHYTSTFQNLIKILMNGFAPSYCKEKINDLVYYIPMVSFCNIPIKDVKLYMDYGKYGIGLSFEKAKELGITPVTYIHENTSFNKSQVKIFDIAQKIFINIPNEDYKLNNYDDFNQINKLTFDMLMYIKNIHTTYKGKDIITYNEREWRYVPDLNNSSRKQIITMGHDDYKFLDSTDYKNLADNKFKIKPHLPEHTLKIELDDIRYVFLKNQYQNQQVINVLNKLYGKERVLKALSLGNLLILNYEVLENDF